MVIGGGSLVWVRRRNGSWWPGRILGPDELPASPLMSPKTGTPVKLLGREDASVEWYNLEKSIRVKAFRCGEFEDCIEKAEASQDVPIKRREKYARREDAILHALELERKLLGMKQHKPAIVTNSIYNTTSDVMKRELNNYSSENYTKKSDPAGCSQFANPKSQMPSRRELSSPEEDNKDNPLYVHQGRYSKPFGTEEAAPGSISRTRVLQDFGLRIAPTKKKDFEFVEWDNLQKPVDNHADVFPCSGQITGGQRHAGSSKSPLPLKRKSFQGGMSEDSIPKRRDRRRPLLKVLESSAKLTSFRSFHPDHDVGIIPMQGEKDPMGSICRAKRSRCIYLPADSNDSSGHVGYSLKQMTTSQTRVDSSHRYDGSLADENTSSGFEAADSDSSERGYSGNTMEDGNLLRDTKSMLPGSKHSGRYGSYNPITSQIYSREHTVDVPVEVGVSKWHMKRKRNIRSSAKCPIEMMDGAVSNTAEKSNSSVERTSYENKGAGFKTRSIDHSSQWDIGHGFYSKRDLSACDAGDFPDKDTSLAQSIAFGSRRYPLTSKAAEDPVSSFFDSDADSHVMLQASLDSPSNATLRRTCKKEPDCSAPIFPDHLGDEMVPTLVDVELEVRARYQGEHVPLVSLMSRLNGKAIIGHPVQVEILEDGFSGPLFSRSGPSRDESTAPSPVWKTARRTAIQRIPRSKPAPSVLEGEESKPLPGTDLESKPQSKKVYSSHFSHQARLAKKSISHARRSASGKFQKKLLKNVNLPGQKIRTLSSLSVGQKRISESWDGKLNKPGGAFGGLIKPDGTVPLVTCVPGKVVFSRILEAVGRPSSSLAHWVLVSGSTVKDKS